MLQIFNFAAPVFITPKSYSEMLAQLAGFTFYVVFGITLALRTIPAIGDTFLSLEKIGPMRTLIAIIPHGSELNLSGVLVALGVAIFSFVIRLHDRISDLLGIRRHFDMQYILIPLADLVGIKLSDQQIVTIAAKRHKLMRQVFYHYASSRADNPLVDKHDIEHALGSWTWFWMCLESAAYLLVATMLAFGFCALTLGSIFLGLILMAVCVAAALYPRLKHCAENEIEAIANNEDAKAEVLNVFNAV